MRTPTDSSPSSSKTTKSSTDTKRYSDPCSSPSMRPSGRTTSPSSLFPSKVLSSLQTPAIKSSGSITLRFRAFTGTKRKSTVLSPTGIRTWSFLQGRIRRFISIPLIKTTSPPSPSFSMMQLLPSCLMRIRINYWSETRRGSFTSILGPISDSTKASSLRTNLSLLYRVTRKSTSSSLATPVPFSTHSIWRSSAKRGNLRVLERLSLAWRC